MSVHTALPIRQDLYQIQDTTLICVPKGALTARFHRISFTGSEKLPDVPHGNVDDHTIDLGPFGDILSVRAVTDYWGQQFVALLTKIGPAAATLSLIAMKDGTAQLTSVGRDTEDRLPALVIGFDPTQEEKSLFCLETDSRAHLVLVQAYPGTGRPVREMRLSARVSGTPVVAELVRRGSGFVLMIVTISGGSLKIYAVDWNDVARPSHADPGNAPDVPALLVNGDGDEAGSLWTVPADPIAQVAAVVTRMRARSTDQQLAIAWSDSASKGNIALIGWEESTAKPGLDEAAPLALGAKVLVRDVPDVSFAPPQAPVYRLAAADLLHAGTDQLVLGYPATCGPYPGCAALMLYTLDESDVTKRKLKCGSRYAVTNADHHPWASIDLYIGAGVFGTCMGVQVVGGGASMRDLMKGRSKVLCGFVPVDPNHGGFPPMTDGAPGVPSICVGPDGPGDGLSFLDPTASRFIAFPSDLTGQSVRLGKPTLQPVNLCTQILAIIQAPPYDSVLTKNPPNVTYSKSSSQVSGYSVSSDSAYTLSKDFGANLHIGALSLSKDVLDSWTRSFNKAKDSSTSKDVSLTATGETHDFLLVHGMSYDVWRYPVLWSSGRAVAGNEILVVVPTAAEPQMKLVPGYHPAYGYRPPSEVGMLLSYVGVEKDGFTEANRLFQPDGILVSESSGGSSESGSDLVSNGDTVGKHYSVSNSISSSASYSQHTQLFDYLPFSFGLNVSQHENFSDSTVSTTHTTRTDQMHWSVSSGSVEDPIYSYNIHPCIYVHKKLGFLVISWDVDLSPGTNYDPKALIQPQNRRLDDPDICLIRVAPFSADVFEAWYSRSIRFDDKTEPGKLKILVDVFNNSINEAGEVTCEFFEGMPTVVQPTESRNKPKLEPPGKSLGDPQRCSGLNALGRETIRLTVPLPEKTPCYIVVRVSCKIPPKKKTYWNVYPPNKLAAFRSVQPE